MSEVDDVYKETETGGRMAWTHCCVGHVSWRTNGPHGGDAGHGGFLEIQLDTNGESTALDVSINGAKATRADKVTLTFRGDSEMLVAATIFDYLGGAVREAVEWKRPEAN